MRSEILAVSLTLVTPLFLSLFHFYFLLVLFPAFSFHFLVSHSPLISSPVFSLPVLNSGYPLPLETTVMFPICLHLAEAKWIRARPKQEQEKSSHSCWRNLLIFHCSTALHIITPTVCAHIHTLAHKRQIHVCTCCSLQINTFSAHQQGYTCSSKLAWAVSCHCREVHNDNYSLGLHPWINQIRHIHNPEVPGAAVVYADWCAVLEQLSAELSAVKWPFLLLFSIITY